MKRTTLAIILLVVGTCAVNGQTRISNATNSVASKDRVKEKTDTTALSLNEIRFKDWTDEDWLDNDYFRALRTCINDWLDGKNRE